MFSNPLRFNYYFVINISMLLYSPVVEKFRGIT